jgi:nicotinate-nucleotide adenylyltransferase
LRIGILGGAFNPPHIGHLVCAQEAYVQLELDKVVFVPTGQAAHREIEDDPGGDVRFELCEAAIDGDERFEVSRVELDREGPSYTADTLEALREGSSDDELFLVLGGDQAASLGSWHEPEKVLERATLSVVERVGYTRNTIAIQLARLRGSDRVRYLDMPVMQVSSTSIRRRVAAGLPIRYLAPGRVVDYIESNGLYGASTQTPAPAT